MFDSCYSYSEEALVQCKTRYLWVLDKHCDYSGFDFAWEPAPWESHFRHAFGSQWQKDSGTYLVPKDGYSETKYNKEQTVTKLTNFENWEGQDFKFDYSWHPDPTDPPYVYQFGTQWQKTGGPKYTVPGATSIKYVDSPKINKTVVDAYWTKPAGKFETLTTHGIQTRQKNLTYISLVHNTKRPVDLVILYLVQLIQSLLATLQAVCEQWLVEQFL